MKLLISILLCLVASHAFAQKNCLETSREIAPRLSPKTRAEFETRLKQAQKDFEDKASDADRTIWLGRRTAYLGRYKDAVRIYSEGIAKFPADARFYRHRGHRFITLRCFDAAIADLEKAVQLIAGKADEIEPDGLPNARNIPTSTLQSNIWYHLALAHYLKGDFRRALKAYREAEKVSTNPDMLVATTHWLYMTLRRLGRAKEAAETLAAVKDDLDVIESTDYYKLIKLYQGKLNDGRPVARNRHGCQHAEQCQSGLWFGKLVSLQRKERGCRKNLSANRSWRSMGKFRLYRSGGRVEAGEKMSDTGRRSANDTHE